MQTNEFTLELDHANEETYSRVGWCHQMYLI